VNATIAIPSGGAYFEGHFPGQPILPGVVELALVLETLARETRRPLALRGIVFARLRQLVLPGHRLELAARELDGGRMRIDLTREGVLVANGELVLGPPEQAGDAAAPLEQRPPDLSALPPLDDLLPQRPPMRFVTSILGAAGDGVSVSACVPAACALVTDGAAPALASLEAAAQAAAAWEALRRWREGGVAAPRVGYLVAVRDVVFYAERIPADQTFLASVRLEAAAPPLTHYRVEVSMRGTPVLRGTIATFLAKQGAADVLNDANSRIGQGGARGQAI
jgi:3-hydroxyacyl-[acyl-carrier-protein] dehydratase